MPSSSATSSEGVKRLKKGRRLYEGVRDLLPFCGPTDELHSQLREAHEVLRSAMNWLEDSPRFELAHRLLDEAGRLARQRFAKGCDFPFENGTYYMRCPVGLAHNRVGMSPAILIKQSHCSICEQDPDDCEHITGRKYDGQACHRVITEAEVLEVSLVGRPNMPDARIESRSIGLSEMWSRLGPGFRPGMTVTCDRCLRDCNGVARPFEETGD